MLFSSLVSEINFHFFVVLVHVMTVMSVALAGSHHLNQRIKVLASSGTSINKKNLNILRKYSCYTGNHLLT